MAYCISRILFFLDVEKEDDYFDIKDINEDEVKQFHNLKSITLLPTENIDEVIEKFEKLGIQAEEL